MGNKVSPSGPGGVVKAWRLVEKKVSWMMIDDDLGGKYAFIGG